MQLVYRALELGYVFVAYDSRGCGHSQGDYISLGTNLVIKARISLNLGSWSCYYSFAWALYIESEYSVMGPVNGSSDRHELSYRQYPFY